MESRRDSSFKKEHYSLMEFSPEQLYNLPTASSTIHDAKRYRDVTIEESSCSEQHAVVFEFLIEGRASFIASKNATFKFSINSFDVLDPE